MPLVSGSGQLLGLSKTGLYITCCYIYIFTYLCTFGIPRSDNGFTIAICDHSKTPYLTCSFNTIIAGRLRRSQTTIVNPKSGFLWEYLEIAMQFRTHKQARRVNTQTLVSEWTLSTECHRPHFKQPLPATSHCREISRRPWEQEARTQHHGPASGHA